MRRVLFPTLLLLLAGCGSARTPADPATLTVVVDVGPASLDPRVGSDESSRRCHQLLYNGLIAYDEHGSVVPDLARSWETPDPLRTIVHLRSGVRFHDGRILTSADVRYTFESILNDEVPSFVKGDLSAIASIETPDPDTVVFHLKEPFAPFLSNLNTGIVPRNAGPDFSRHPVGTGPFRLVQYRKDQDLLFTAHADYFDGPPPCRTLRLKIVPEASSRQQELLKGTGDLVVNDLTPDQVQALRREPQLQILSRDSNSYSYLGFNLEDPLLRNVRVRQAIASALDRERLIAVLLRGLARPATGLLPPDHWAYEKGVRVFAYDPERATRLLDEAGFPDPDGPGPRTRFHLTYKTTTNQLAREQASVFQEQLRKVGIEMEIRSFEWGTFYDDIKAGRFQIFSLQWTQIVDPDIFRLRFGSAYFPPSGFNRVRYRNPEVDRLLEEGVRATDREARRAAYSRIQKILAEELPYVSLYHKANVAVMNRRVEGFVLTPGGDFRALARVRLP